MSLFKTLGSVASSVGTAVANSYQASIDAKVSDVRLAQEAVNKAVESYIEYPGQYSAGDLDRANVRLLEAGRKLMTAHHHWAEPATFNPAVPTMSSQATAEPAKRSSLSRPTTCWRPSGIDVGPTSVRHYDDETCRYCKD